MEDAPKSCISSKFLCSSKQYHPQSCFLFLRSYRFALRPRGTVFYPFNRFLCPYPYIIFLAGFQLCDRKLCGRFLLHRFGHGCLLLKLLARGILHLVAGDVLLLFLPFHHEAFGSCRNLSWNGGSFGQDGKCLGDGACVGSFQFNCYAGIPDIYIVMINDSIVLAVNILPTGIFYNNRRLLCLPVISI